MACESQSTVFRQIARRSYADWPEYDSTPLYDRTSLATGRSGGTRRLTMLDATDEVFTETRGVRYDIVGSRVDFVGLDLYLDTE